MAEAWADVLIPCWTSMGSDETRRYGRYREVDGTGKNGILQTFRPHRCRTVSRGFHSWQLQKRGCLHIGAWHIPPLEIRKPRCIVVIHRGFGYLVVLYVMEWLFRWGQLCTFEYVLFVLRVNWLAVIRHQILDQSDLGDK